MDGYHNSDTRSFGYHGYPLCIEQPPPYPESMTTTSSSSSSSPMYYHQQRQVYPRQQQYHHQQPSYQQQPQPTVTLDIRKYYLPRPLTPDTVTTTTSPDSSVTSSPARHQFSAPATPSNRTPEHTAASAASISSRTVLLPTSLSSSSSRKPGDSTGSRTLRERFRTWKKRQRKPRPVSAASATDLLATGSQSEIRYDSLRKIDRSDAPIEEDLKNAPWYQAGIPREIALEMLTQEEIGSFVVRDSTTHPGCYALSVKVPKFDNPSGISHYLILRTSHGVKLKGLDKEWTSLTALVTHHSVMRELLPCPLRLPRAANNPAFDAADDSKGAADQEEDEDYQRLADCTHMMHDLNL